MTTSTDWIPRNHEQLYDQAAITAAFLSVEENRTRLGFGPYSAQIKWLNGEFFAKYEAFKTAFESWHNPATRTKLLTEQLLEAEKTFKEAYRKLYTGFLRESPLVTDNDLIAMSLPKRSTERNPSPVATTYPDYDVDSSMMRRLTIHFYDQGKVKSKAKPKGQHGAEIRWAILSAPPTKIDDLTNSSFDTRTPLTLEFGEEQRGETVYFCLRWENNRGEKGPWSKIENAIIP
jgi:hypothetical protein